jgi:lipid A disaccharide synthetase
MLFFCCGKEVVIVVVESKWKSNNDLYTHFVGHTVAQEVSIVAHKNYNNEKVLINLPWKICFFYLFSD